MNYENACIIKILKNGYACYIHCAKNYKIILVQKLS